MSAKRIPFDPSDERAIASGATWAIVSAVVSTVSSLLSVLVAGSAGGDQEDLLGEIIGLVITIISSAWLFQAGMLFRKVATTDVADQKYLIAGFAKLRSYFRLVVILVIIALCFAVFMLITGGAAALAR